MYVFLVWSGKNQAAWLHAHKNIVLISIFVELWAKAILLGGSRDKNHVDFASSKWETRMLVSGKSYRTSINP